MKQHQITHCNNAYMTMTMWRQHKEHHTIYLISVCLHWISSCQIAIKLTQRTRIEHFVVFSSLFQCIFSKWTYIQTHRRSYTAFLGTVEYLETTTIKKIEFVHLISHNKNNNERVSAARVRELAIKRVAELRIMEIIQITDSYSLTRAHGSLTAILWKKKHQLTLPNKNKCTEKVLAKISSGRL